MDIVSYGEFSQTFHRRTMQRHLPLSGAIEVTRRCPLTCVHCYNNLPMADHEASRSELTLQEHRRILDELADAGWLMMDTLARLRARPKDRPRSRSKLVPVLGATAGGGCGSGGCSSCSAR